MRFISLFSGVGGFDLGLEAAGWQCVAQVEWDQHCQAVLARHWPDVPRWGDVSDVLGADLPAADAVVFGSPCQDLSVAGKRAGFDGTRSVLFYEATRIIKEMQDAGRGPAWVVWENVVGALSSSDGRDFGAILRELADIGALDIAWRVLDARWFGVPQRRRRVFVVADLGGHRAGAIHAESSGVRWHPHQSLTAWKDTTDQARPSTSISSVTTGFTGCQFADYVEGVGTLRATSGDLGGGSETLIAGPINARDGKSVDSDGAANGHLVVKQRPDSGAESLTEIAVRRLTAIECERLMGWPDDHTRWRANGTQIADSHRYTMCGNGVAAPVAQWIGERISEAGR